MQNKDGSNALNIDYFRRDFNRYPEDRPFRKIDLWNYIVYYSLGIPKDVFEKFPIHSTKLKMQHPKCP